MGGLVGGGAALGGSPSNSGGASAAGGLSATGASPGAGGAGLGGGASSGGSAPMPVDCSPLSGQPDWELCSESAEGCGVVFEDGAGCAEVCASAGLVCGETWENAEDSCGPDQARDALDCDAPSGHESDYCFCVGSGNPGSGGTSGVGGNEGAGGSSAGGSSAGGSSAGGASTSGGAAGSGGSSNQGPCEVPGYIASEAAPIGWAMQGGTTTGGGSVAPILVTSLSQFKSEVSGSTPKVIYVQGDFSPDDITFGSNKTVIGCSSGAHIKGHVQIGSGSSNLILRNLRISGYGIGNCALDPSFDSGEGCSSGADAISVNGTAHHVWFDHCTVMDGTDGNLDITNDANYVTVSWTKFAYTPRTDNVGSDSTGASGHRYSNLVGGTDSAPTNWPSTIPLNVTWHHNWWADNVVERMPRVRYGRNHLFNNYYNSQTANYCVRAGIEASVLLEGNYFEGVDTPHEFNSDSNEQTAYIATGSGAKANTYSSVSGGQETGGGGDAFTPPYSYTVDSASGVPAAIKAGAGVH